MTKKNEAAPAPAPTEFTSFVRRIGIDSFDRFARKKLDLKTPASGNNPLLALANLWVGLKPEEKNRFFDQVIAAGQTAALAAPGVLAMAKLKSARKQAGKDDAPATEQGPEPKKEKKGKKKKAGKDAEKREKKSGKKKEKKDDKT